VTAPTPADDPYAPDVPRTAWAQALATLDMLPDAVRLRRARLGLSLRAAAVQIGTTNATVHRLEHGGGVNEAMYRRALAWLDRTEEEASRG